MEDQTEKVEDAPAAKRQRTDGGSKAANGSHKGEGQQQQQQQQQGKGKKGKQQQGADARMLFSTMHQAAKNNNLQVAMSAFRECTAAGVKLNTGMLNTLMFLACGGEQWERYARDLPLLSIAELEAMRAAAGSSASGVAGSAEAGAGGGAGGEGGEGGDGEEGAKPQQKPQQQRPNKVVAKVPPPEVLPSREELVAAMDELWAQMQSSGVPPDSGTYLGLARKEALRNDPAAALHWAKECIKKGNPLQLRQLHPAQVGYCLAADVAALHEVDALLAAHGLDCGEYEYARLLEGIAAAGSYEQLQAALLRVQSDLNQLSPATAGYISAFFESNPAAQRALDAATAAAPPAEAAASGAAAAAPAEGAEPSARPDLPSMVAGLLRSEAEAGAGPGSAVGLRWAVTRGPAVGDDGTCEAAGGKLRVIDLEEREWTSFAEAIADLARNNSRRADDIDAFIEWLVRNGPFDILVDAANVAFFGQNHEGGGFCWRQVQAMYDTLRARFPDRKALVMVHRKRVQDEAASTAEVQGFLGELRARKCFYNTPFGSNDDWYWLYASVRAKHAGLLVSNDLLRDHIFSLLRPKHFLKWKERHIARYAFAQGSGPDVLNYTPPKYERRPPHRKGGAGRRGPGGEAGKEGGEEEAKQASEREGSAEGEAEVKAAGKEKGQPQAGKQGGEGAAEEQTEQGTPPERAPSPPVVDPRVFDLLMPKPYTACVQQLPESGAWMVPVTDGSWVVVRPVRA